MSDFNNTQGSRGRPSHDQQIPPYNSHDPYKHQRPPQGNYMPESHITNEDRAHVQHHPPDEYGSYYVEDTPPQPLPVPRSHFSNQQHYDPRRGPPPSRPPRPEPSPTNDYVPSPQQRRHQMYQQFFEQSPTHHGTGEWTDDGYASAGAQRQPLGLQALINQLQKRAPLGPPPSARRGPSSYYSQSEVSQVHPIVEESDKGSTKQGSISSNNAIQIGVPSNLLRDDSSSIYSGVPSMPPSLRPRDSDMSAIVTDHDKMPRPDSSANALSNLVRKAGIGLQTKPKITTVKSSDRLKQGLPSDTPTRREFPLAGPGERQTTQTPPGTRSGSQSPRASRKLYPRSRGGSSDALGAASVQDASASDSDEPDRLVVPTPRVRSKSPLVPLELRKNDKNIEPSPVTPSAFKDGKKRPPHLNMSAVRAAEQRGSLTSLPDLIKRATRLASNLDRGKTASRLGMSAWLNDGNNNEKGKSGQTTANSARRSGGSLTDMLASFPPPALGTPPQSQHGRDEKAGFTSWSSNLPRSETQPSDSDLGKRQPRKKRCCGIPLWLLILLIIIGICLVAAAIVIPVVLVVIPEQRNANAPNTTSTCESRYTCQNGGASIVASSGNCQCLCINGFTGLTCTDQDRTGCYTVSIGNTSNVTIGSSIPRIISDASSNFSIPLDSSTLLGLFSSAAISCTVENALVTFNGLAQRDVERRQDTTSEAGAATSNGIVFATGSPTTATTLATTTSSSATAAATTSATASFTADSTTLDFARTAVLFVFQSTGSFNSSYAAQQYFQSFFSSTSSGLVTANSLGIGSGYSADLSGFKITMANGTVVGGGPGHA